MNIMTMLYLPKPGTAESVNAISFAVCFRLHAQTESSSAALLDDDDAWNDFTLLSKSVMYSFVSCM